MADRPEAEIIMVLPHDQAEMAALVAVAAAAVVVAETMALITVEMTGTADLPLEPEGKAEEAVTRHEALGTLLRPNDAAPQPGHAVLLPPRQQQCQQDRDRIQIAMTVGVSSFSTLTH